MEKPNGGGPARGQPPSPPPPPGAPAAPADAAAAFPVPAGDDGLRVDVPSMRELPPTPHGAGAAVTSGAEDEEEERTETATRGMGDGAAAAPPPASATHGSPGTAPAAGAPAAASPPQAGQAGGHGTPHSSSRKTSVVEGAVPDAGGASDANEAAAQAPSPPPPALPAHPAPEYVVFHKDPDRDGVDFKAVLEGITNPQTIMWVNAAFRTVAFVSFPLFTIAIHPNTMYRLGFPQMLIASIISTSTHRATLGEQIGLHSWIWRGITYMLVFGTAVDAWQVQAHIGAWYGLLAAGIFLAGLVSHGMMRRFMYLYFFIFMMEIRMYDHYFGTLPITNAAWAAADYFIGSLLGMAALCFPYPLLVKNLVDLIMSKIFDGLGKMFFAMISFVWSPDAHAACLFFDDRSPFMKIEAILEVMPPLLWFANWEPLEFPLHNPIRRLKLSLLRRVMALTYAAFSCGRTVAALHKQQADRVAMHRIRCSLFQAAHGTELKAIENGSHASSSRDTAASKSRTGGDDVPADVRTAKESIAELRKNTAGCVKEFGMALMQSTVLVGTALNTPELLVGKVPFAALREKDTVMRRSLRLETLEVMRIQSEIVSRRRAARQQAAAKQQEQAREDEEQGVAVEDDEGNAHAPFGRPQPYHVGRADARLILEHRDIIDDAEVFIRMNEIFFHLLLSMIAGELVSFGEQMRDYKPPMSLGRRLLRYFIIEPWNDFWEELWCRLSFARPCDYRTVKDAIRMTCAYLAATALNLETYVAPGGLYFFGVTILLGLPVEEESLNMCVNRMAGNSLGCALGFLAYHNGNNLAQMIAMTLCFTFLQQCFKNNPLYGQTFFYSSFITMAGLATSMVTMELLTRMIASCYTIVAYMLCCMLIFPNDSNKICSGYRCKLAKVMSEVVDDVALTLRLPIEHRDTTPVGAEEDLNEPVAYPKRNTEAMRMCSQLNVQVSLASVLLSMCDKWAPFAAREPVVRGSSPFPAGPSTLIGHAHKRMVANLRLLVFGVQLLHRPRTSPLSPNTSRILAGSVADFVDEFADCMRLLCQDYIDSIQLSRKWSYPLSLSRTSQISRLRVRLQAINYEYYVVVADYMSRGTFGMTQADFQALRLEAAQREAAEQAPPQEEQVRVRVGNDGDEAGEDALAHMSFADRYLRARCAVDTLLNGDATGATTANGQATAEELRNSMHLPARQGSASLLGANGPSPSFVYRAPLDESAVAPKDAFPMTQESAEREVQQQLREEEAREADAQGHQRPASPSTESQRKGSEDESHQPYYEPVVPSKSKSRVSKLILFPDQGPEAFIPLYRGPAFTFVEDALATEKDTDFAAVMTILCSCDSLITELQGLTGSVNGVSSYEKQLHDSSIITAQLDKWSAWLQGYKKDIHDRYHYPAPPPQSRGSLHAQSDPWKDWRF